MAALQQFAHAVQEQLQQQNQLQAQQIGEMHQQLLAMQQELHSLRSDPAAAQQRASAGVSEHAEPRSRGELLRAAKRPECFKGEHGVYVLNWLEEMNIFLENCEPPPSESQKITLAKSFLREEALHWWCAREKDVLRAVASGDPSLVQLTPAVTTWDAFQKAASEYFCPRGVSDEARNELHRLRQNQFRSLEAYADRFEAVSRRIEVPLGQSIEEELIATFKTGLLNGLIRLSLTNTKPRTLFQAIQQAHQAESDLRVAGARENSGRQDYPHRHGSFDRSREPLQRYSGNHFGRFRPYGETSLGHPSHFRSNRSSGAPVPMDLSAMAGTEDHDSDSDSDRNSDPRRRDRVQGPLEQDDSLSSPPGSADDRSPQGTPEPADCSSRTCELNVTQMQRTSTSSRCQKCGQQTQPRQRFSSDCWNCGQTGHLRRDCPKPPQAASVTSRTNRDGSGKPRHF
jgi:hypothetical protein